jgi:FkbM family methyltransferase
VNGGVFEGFELPFLSLKLPVGATVHNVDPLGYDFLSDYSRNWVEAASIDWREHRVALARGPGEVEMGEIGNAQLSRAVAPGGGGHRTVPAISIDALVAEENIADVDLIKLDLEGGDAEALAGAVNTITNHRPQIAASIYHYVNDFWRIPELLMRICDDYHFYLGAYSRERWETILYAIPREIERDGPQRIAA